MADGTYATDASELGCEWYNVNPQDCSNEDYNDVDFSASEACCACGGGIGNYFDPWNAEVDNLSDILAKADDRTDIAVSVLKNPLKVLKGFFTWGE